MRKEIRIPLLIWAVFEIIAVVLWLTQENLFYLLNFSYIGTCLAIGLWLYGANIRYARHAVQLAVGLYMLVYLGILSRENMQIEGFWYYLFSGVFEAATIHYAVAKIFGPLIFGRGWCGYACWTAMVLDFLPYKQPQTPPKEKLRSLRYVVAAFLRGALANVGIGAGALTAGHLLADLNLLIGVGNRESLLIGVDGNELDALRSGLDHSVDNIVARTADTDYLYSNNILRSCFGFEIHSCASLCFISSQK